MGDAGVAGTAETAGAATGPAAAAGRVEGLPRIAFFAVVAADFNLFFTEAPVSRLIVGVCAVAKRRTADWFAPTAGSALAGEVLRCREFIT